jgi:hypothetical protein
MNETLKILQERMFDQGWMFPNLPDQRNPPYHLVGSWNPTVLARTCSSSRQAITENQDFYVRGGDQASLNYL